jgi:divalent metal cation (Fe/Co/Zn/Cd) transporter
MRLRPGKTMLAEAHKLDEKAATAIRQAIPRVDVMIHAELEEKKSE